MILPLPLSVSLSSSSPGPRPCSVMSLPCEDCGGAILPRMAVVVFCDGRQGDVFVCLSDELLIWWLDCCCQLLGSSTNLLLVLS